MDERLPETAKTCIETSMSVTKEAKIVEVVQTRYFQTVSSEVRLVVAILLVLSILVQSIVLEVRKRKLLDMTMREVVIVVVLCQKVCFVITVTKIEKKKSTT